MKVPARAKVIVAPSRSTSDQLEPTDEDEAQDTWSGWGDSNSRPPAPKAGALTKLRYTPVGRPA